VVQYKNSGIVDVFVDNGGLYHAFCSNAALSTSFLDLCSFNGLRESQLDPETVVEFLHYGLVSFDRTLFADIRKITPEEIVRISPAVGISHIRKSLLPLGSPPPCSLEDVICDLISSISNERVSVDLTGGMDTRFLVVLLHYFGLSFEVAIRGNDDDYDVQIAREVADVLGKPLHVCYPVIDDLEAHLPAVLDICDGLFDVVQSYGALQLQRERAKRGITLTLSAGGGELYRDHFWLQDFPFYSGKRANLNRFCSFRLLPTDPHHSHLAGKYRDISRGYRKRFLRDLSQYEVAGNTQTYDRIIYRVRYRELLGRYLTNHCRVLQCYSPFMERDAVMYGYNMPRRARFFDYYFRSTATKCLPEAARIRTTRGFVTLSSEPVLLTRDVYRYCDDKLRRVARRLGQRYFKRKYRSCGRLDQPVGHIDLFPTLRRSQLVRQAITRLKDLGIVSPTLKIEDMEDRYLGTALTLALVVDRLQHDTELSSAAVSCAAAARDQMPRL
jgi:hypothetical protein